ncbi:hypothetical protein RJ640_029986 [Escallonia rubra]|uniref:EF-hand domain-containing protein n=1 Tax=Escallonia rubra TaxID=112253 RepID=A0AA88QJ67_9ASTE|nr:hypothetical protein RJ640_029986 [Escallonia rubra]
MEKLTLCLVFLILGLGMARCRSIRLLNSTDPLVDSDLVEHNQYPSISLGGKGMLSSSSSGCVRMYGFFPCADTVGGYIFQIAVYQYLLIIGNKLVTTGSTAMFNILGTGIFGASVFRVLMVLPSIVMVIVSGVFTTQASAQNQVSLAVAVYVGSTVFSLTLLWGMCVIFGSNKLHETKSSSEHTGPSTSELLLVKEKPSHSEGSAFCTGSGITLDKKTSTTAGIMLLSLIPFVLVLLVNIFKTSSGSRVVVLIALVVSTLGLLSYFAFQIWDPWIQERSLEYSKFENLLAGFLHHVQEQAKGKLINDKGEPDIHVIRSAFARFDKDSDKVIRVTELEALIRDMQPGQLPVDKTYALKQLQNAFDVDSNGKITDDEFAKGIIGYLSKAEDLAKDGDSRTKEILRQATTEAETLLMDNGEPNIDHMKSIFKKFDSDNDKQLSKSELKKLLEKIKSEESRIGHEELVKKVVDAFDKDALYLLSLHVLTILQAKWKEVDSLMYEAEAEGGRKYKVLTWKFNRFALQVLLGIAILTFLAGPLLYSIQLLSAAMGIPSFFISFVILPIAMNARTAILAIYPASRKNKKTASLTFSEIYGGVVVNNIMGLSTLLAIVYAKDLTWDYNAEVVILLVICAVIGLIAFLRSTYPLWTCCLAFFLYPFSLVFYYVLQYVWGWE